MNYIKSLKIITLLLLFVSCDKFLEDYSQDLVMPKTIQDLDEILLGEGYLPRKEVSELKYGGLTWFLLMIDDDSNTVMERVASRGTFDMDSWYYGHFAWQFEPGRSYNGRDLRDDSDTWNELYRRINALNIILSEIDNISIDVEKDIKTSWRVQAEAYFLRAQFYLTLVNLYADMYTPQHGATTLGVPLKLTHYVEHDKDKESQFERTPVASVYNQIVLDLEQAVDYFTKSEPQPQRSHRASKSAAILLLSRVHLYMQNWEQAASWGQQAIAGTGILQNYKNILAGQPAIDSDNPELIFAQGPLNTQNVFTARGGDFCVSSDLYNSYDDNDYRKSIYFEKVSATDSVALSRKFRKGIHISSVSDLFLLRKSEAYLNTIEALAMQNKLGEAQQLLDQFRSSRMLEIPASYPDQQTLVQGIHAERRKELCFEGHRWFDLRRYSKLEKFSFDKEIVHVYSVYNWDDKNKPIKSEYFKLNKGDLAYTLPIPKAVIDFDRGMPNNPRETRASFMEVNYEE